MLTSIMKCQCWKQMCLTVWFILFLSISAGFFSQIVYMTMKQDWRIVWWLCLTSSFLSTPCEAQHASAAALAEQQKQEMERQREQLSEACAVGAFFSCPGKEWRCLLHTSYQFKLIHFCWRSFLRLVIANSQFTQFGCIMRLECSFHTRGKRQ